MNHSPTPWYIATNGDFKKLRPVTPAVDISEWDEYITWEDISRIRDCVNACTGIPSEQLRAVFDEQAEIIVRPLEVDDV